LGALSLLTENYPEYYPIIPVNDAFNREISSGDGGLKAMQHAG
jgi:hypothetical protein